MAGYSHTVRYPGHGMDSHVEAYGSADRSAAASESAEEAADRSDWDGEQLESLSCSS